MSAVSSLIVSAVMWAVLTAFTSTPAWGVLPREKLSDPVLESRAATLSKELRCVVCQNQTIDDSNAPLAADMRVLLRERIAAGDSDGQAIAYLVERYGNFVLLRPPFQPNTWILWGAPFAAFLVAAAAFLTQIRKRAAARRSVPVTAGQSSAVTDFSLD